MDTNPTPSTETVEVRREMDPERYAGDSLLLDALDSVDGDFWGADATWTVRDGDLVARRAAASFVPWGTGRIDRVSVEVVTSEGGVRNLITWAGGVVPLSGDPERDLREVVDALRGAEAEAWRRRDRREDEEARARASLSADGAGLD